METINEEICTICMDSGEVGDMITTPCKHPFHKECLTSLLRPNCPLCKKNITKFLIKNGVSKKEIMKRIQCDDYRILYDSVTSTHNYEDLDEDDLMVVSILAKRMIGLSSSSSTSSSDGWKEVYRNLLLDIILSAQKLLQEMSLFNSQKKEPGVFLVYCDLSTLISNIIDGYSSSLLQWKSIKDCRQDPLLKGSANYISNRIKNPSKQFGLLIILEDDTLEDKETTFISPEIITENHVHQPLSSYKAMLKTICECKTFRQLDDKDDNNNNIECIWASKNLNFIKQPNPSPFTEEKSYTYISDFLKGEIEPKILDKNCRYAAVTFTGSTNIETNSYVITKRTNKIIYSLYMKKHIKGDAVFVSKFLTRAHEDYYAVVLRIIHTDFDIVHQYICQKQNKYTCCKFRPEIVDECQNVCSITGKKILKPHREIYL